MASRSAKGIGSWPIVRQLVGSDPLGRGAAAVSAETAATKARIATADRVVGSVCPYCAVGCGQKVYVRDGKVIQIEGDPDSPVSRGRLCPKGAATLELTTGPARLDEVLYRAPGGRAFERIGLEQAMEMVADRLIETRRRTFEWESGGLRTRRTLGIASLGGATLDNEENYLIKKLFTALGIIQVENQARVCHSSTVAALAKSFGRGGSTTCLQDLQNADCIIIQGSNFAEAHPVGFQWVMEAKERGATIIHVDPRFTRTSAVADLHVPIRAGSDIVFLGGLIRYAIEEGKYFEEYVRAYTNAAKTISADYGDTEDLAGLFSGYDAEGRRYDTGTWQYAGTDESLEAPDSVFQIVRRHFSRYTPEMVADVCGVPEVLFERVCRLVTENSGRERTTAFCYAVGWTQHTVGVQYIRTACILQLLLGNIGRPGGGIMALRGHASIQGSSDIPTLFDLLPGYLNMPRAAEHTSLDDLVGSSVTEKGYWTDARRYYVSLLKAWWGEAATAENDYCFDYLPRLTGDHSTYPTVDEQIKGNCAGYFLMGENPAVGSANSRMQRAGLSQLEWLVVRDFSLIESATWWLDGPEIESGEQRTEDIETEVFFFPAAAHTEKDGSFTNTNRMLQWHTAAVEPRGDARSDLWFMYHLGRIIRERLAGSDDPMDRPLLDLTWDYPTDGHLDEPSAAAVLAEINGRGPDGAPLSGYLDLRDDGSTSCGCWIYSGSYAHGVNQTARRSPGDRQNWLGGEWGWAWPANRRVLYNRASADPEGQPWSERKALVWWDGEGWTGHDTPDCDAAKPPSYVPPAGARGPEALAGTDPFVMQDDGLAWLFVPRGLADGPLPAHYEPQDSPVQNAVYPQQRNPTRGLIPRKENRYHPSGDEKGADVYPYVVTTYRLTEHFTAGGMSRWLPYLSELQPELFCEVSPELASERGLVHGDFATIVTARAAIEARVLVTRRMTPVAVGGKPVHQIGLPYHFGPNGLATGDAANELASVAMDPNSHIQEVKAFTADIRPGRRPRGPGRVELVEDYQRRAGVTELTGLEA